MEGPRKPTPNSPVKPVSGHDNAVFAGDDTHLPTITALVMNEKIREHESSRL